MTPLHDHRFPGMTFADIRAELGRADAASDTAGAVAKGRMTHAEAAHHAAIVAALCQDVARFADAHAPLAAGRPLARLAPPTHAIAWETRRAFLFDELTRRQRTYPAAIAKGNLAPAAATRQFDRLAALLALYEEGHDFTGTRDEWRERFEDMLAQHRLGLRHNWRLTLDTMPPAAASPLPAPASGQPEVSKGPAHDHDRPRHTA